MTGLRIWPELDQGTDEWLAVRRGVLTASVIGKLLTPSLKVANNDVSRSLTMTLAAERITGHVEDMRMTDAMFRGVLEEPLARDMYERHHAPVEEVGFMLRDFGGFTIGYSPDGLVGDDGLIEIKSRGQRAQIATVLADEVPAANMAQLQTGLLVSGRQWIEYLSYSSGMALYVKRVYPDPAWQDALLAAAAKFEQAAAAIISTYRDAVRGLPVAERTQDLEEIVI